MKKVVVHIINYIFISLVFAILNNQIKKGILYYNNKHYCCTYQHFYFKDDLIAGLVVVLLIYILYFIWLKLVKKKNAIGYSFLFAILTYLLLGILFAALAGWITFPTFFLSILPIFIAAVLLPFSESLIVRIIKLV